MITHGDVDQLVAESKRLRDELLRTAAKLDTFTEQLMEQINGEASHGDGPRDTGAGPDSA